MFLVLNLRKFNKGKTKFKFVQCYVRYLSFSKSRLFKKFHSSLISFQKITKQKLKWLKIMQIFKSWFFGKIISNLWKNESWAFLLKMNFFPKDKHFFNLVFFSFNVLKITIRNRLILTFDRLFSYLSLILHYYSFSHAGALSVFVHEWQLVICWLHLIISGLFGQSFINLMYLKTF